MNISYENNNRFIQILLYILSGNRFMEKRYLTIFFMLIFLSIPNISANFVCGQVDNYIGETGNDNISAAWFDVNIFYSENESSKIKCDISPHENKFCCDPLEIKNVQWGVDKVINAEIIQGNYFTDKVSISISTEGFSLFPKMNLKKGIDVVSPIENVFINATYLDVFLKSSGRFNNLKYIINSSENTSEVLICTNCNESEFIIEDLPYGPIEIIFIAYSSDGEEMIETKTIYNLQYLEFDRKISCEKCRDNFIPSGALVNVTVFLKSSHEIKGTLSDHFSNKWEYVHGGDFGEYSESHYKTSWFIEGQDIKRSYVLISPRILLTRKYDFFSYFEKIQGNKETYIIYKFYKFLGIKNSMSKKLLFSQLSYSFFEISNDQPMVFFIEDDYLTQIAIYPSKTFSPSYASLNFKNPKLMQYANHHFYLDSSLFNDEIQNIVIRYKIEKPSNSNLKVKDSKLYHFDESLNKWTELETISYFEDDEFFYYESYSTKKGNYAIKRDYEKIR